MNSKSLLAESEHPVPLDPNLAAIEFRSVTFRYPSRPDHPALNELSLNIKQGESVALVGPSGAGKSTLFELIQRFYDPQSGSILLGAVDITQCSLEDLRHMIGIVPQQPILFSTSVFNNIAYGREQCSEEEVIQAAKAAHAHEFIVDLPGQYQADLGEQGTRLSGGQKQRIAIARAILKNPRLLLLDEATSALDTESEHLIQTALKDVMRDRTTVIIAHRLSTILHVDRIVVLDKGRILAQGTHHELIKTCPLYQRLAELQFNEQALAAESLDALAEG